MKAEVRRGGQRLEPIPRGDLPSQDEIKGILHELARFNFFKRELPTFPVSFPQGHQHKSLLMCIMCRAEYSHPEIWNLRMREMFLFRQGMIKHRR